jgi:hypothetical protein
MLTSFHRKSGGDITGCAVATIEEIRPVKEEAERELLKRPGVTGVDVGYKYIGGKETGTLAIRVFVEAKKDVQGHDAIPREIRGVPTDVIERKLVLH